MDSILSSTAKEKGHTLRFYFFGLSSCIATLALIGHLFGFQILYKLSGSTTGLAPLTALSIILIAWLPEWLKKNDNPLFALSCLSGAILAANLANIGCLLTGSDFTACEIEREIYQHLEARTGVNTSFALIALAVGIFSQHTGRVFLPLAAFTLGFVIVINAIIGGLFENVELYGDMSLITAFSFIFLLAGLVASRQQAGDLISELTRSHNRNTIVILLTTLFLIFAASMYFGTQFHANAKQWFSLFVALTISAIIVSVISSFQQILTKDIQIKRSFDELRMINQKLSLEEAANRQIFDLSPKGFVLLDKAGRIIRANKIARYVLTNNASEVAGKRLADFLSEDSAKVINANLARLLKDSSKDTAPGEFFLETNLGVTLNAFVKVLTLSDERYILASIDPAESENVIDRVRAYAEKVEALECIVGGIAHEFNNANAIALGKLQLAAKKIEDTKASENVAAAITALNRAIGLTHQLQSFTIFSFADTTAIPLQDIVSQLISMGRLEFGDKFSISIECDPQDLFVSTSQAELSTVFQIIIDNAKYATVSGGSLKIRIALIRHANETHSDNQQKKIGQVLISFIDTGCGIEEENLNKIFDPFFTTKPVGDGKGLGLATAYGYVKRNGGDIAVHSVIGEGTTVELKLPIYGPQSFD